MLYERVRAIQPASASGGRRASVTANSSFIATSASGRSDLGIRLRSQRSAGRHEGTVNQPISRPGDTRRQTMFERRSAPKSTPPSRNDPIDRNGKPRFWSTASTGRTPTSWWSCASSKMIDRTCDWSWSGIRSSLSIRKSPAWHDAAIVLPSTRMSPSSRSHVG